MNQAGAPRARLQGVIAPTRRSIASCGLESVSQALLLVAMALVVVPSTGAQPLAAEDECIRSQLQVQVVDREIVAFGSGTSRGLLLDSDEHVGGRFSSGCVAAVTTNRRFMFTSSRLRDIWYAADLELNEEPLGSPLMGNTIVALVTNRRFFGFDGLHGRFVSGPLRSRESVMRTDVGANIAVAVTDQRLLGFSVGAPSLQEFTLHLREEVESVEATSDVVTVWTSRRILYFGSSGGGWSERRRDLD